MSLSNSSCSPSIINCVFVCFWCRSLFFSFKFNYWFLGKKYPILESHRSIGLCFNLYFYFLGEKIPANSPNDTIMWSNRRKAFPALCSCYTGTSTLIHGMPNCFPLGYIICRVYSHSLAAIVFLL